MRMNFGPRFCDMRRVLPRAVQQVNRAKGVGVSTIVDATAVNLGRDIHLLREVSQQTGVHLIASTGFYAQDEPWLKEQDPGYLFDLLDEECKKGIYDTDAKPGIVKCAVGRQGLTPTRKKILKLSAKVALANDLPLFCHHEVATQAGPEILDLLLAEGMDPKRVVLGHAGDSQDLAYIFSLLERGCFIGDDRYGYGPCLTPLPTASKPLSPCGQRDSWGRFSSPTTCPPTWVFGSPWRPPWPTPPSTGMRTSPSCSGRCSPSWKRQASPRKSRGSSPQTTPGRCFP